jgi:hypothetical protein
MSHKQKFFLNCTSRRQICRNPDFVLVCKVGLLGMRQNFEIPSGENYKKTGSEFRACKLHRYLMRRKSVTNIWQEEKS